MSIKTAFVVLSALTSAAAIGCSGGGSDGSNPATSASAIRASLHRAKDCPDLLNDLKADAKWKLDKSISYSIDGIKACQARYPDTQCAYYGGYGHPVAMGGGRGGVDFGGDDAATGAPTSGSAGPLPPSAPSGSSSSGSSSGSNGAQGNDSSSKGESSTSPGAASYSETNTQVKGVDEADIVKNDGKNLYILHGSQFKVVQAFPATEMKDVGTADIEGTPTEMFVADGKVVVYSQVNGAKVITAAGLQPRKQYTEFGYAYAGGSGGAARPDIAPVPPGGGYYPPGGQPEVYIPLTKITVLALQGTTPVVTRESYYEGNYLDSRRVGSSVRTVFQGYTYGPQLKYDVYSATPVTTMPSDPNAGGDLKGNGEIAPPNPYPQTGTAMIAALEKLRAENRAIIDASVINDWLPNTFVKTGATVTAQTTQCNDFYVPTTGSTQSGITEVSTLDLARPEAPPRATAILGHADTVYGNATSMYLAANAWVELPVAFYDDSVGSSDGWSGSGSTSGSVGSGTTPASPPPDMPTPKPGVGTRTVRPRTTPVQVGDAIAYSNANTHLHKFEFATDAAFANYVASGTIRGGVKDQFALDEKDGILRAATTESRSYITKDGRYAPADGRIIEKGSPPPARPQSVNHLFTLEQKGPWLETIGDGGDLAPNESIYSVRFVESRGYIVTFRQVDPLFVFDLSVPSAPKKLGELTIPGFSTYMHPLDAGHLLTIGRSGNRELQLKIFDVTDGTNPREATSLTFTGGDGSSDAEYDHKAFTYFPQPDGTGLLALPFYSYNYNDASSGPGGYYGPKSSLEVFRVTTGTIDRIGAIDATTLISNRPNGYCGGYYGPSVRRGVFLDTTVYAISYGGIAAKDIKNLGGNAITFPLSTPKANDYYGYPVPSCDLPPEPPKTEPAPQQ